MHKNKKSGIIGIILTILILTTLVIITNIDTYKLSSIEGIANKLVMPMQNGLTYLKNKMAGNNKFFEDINNLKNENKELKKLLYKELDKLKERDKLIMILRYGLYNSLEYTQKEVAEKLGISQSYISRIEKKVIKRLKSLSK